MESCLICYEDISAADTFLGNESNTNKLVEVQEGSSHEDVIDSKDDNENYNYNSDGFNSEDVGNECNNDEEGNATQQHELQPQLQQQGTFSGLSCGHHFCQHCLRQHVVVSIENKTYPPVCPAQHCKQIMSDEICLALLAAATSTSTLQQQQDNEETENAEEDDDMDIETGLSSKDTTITTTTTTTTTTNETIQSLSTKFQRLKMIHENPTSAITCTKCDAVFVPPLVGEGGYSSIGVDVVDCPECRHRFCKIHGDIHLGMSCYEYHQSDAYRNLVQSEQLLDRYTKQCSRCGARIQKSTGCDYVVCGNCKKDMCYRCGTHIHMTGDQFRKCERCGTYDMAHDASLITQIPFWICVSLGFVAFTVLYPILGIVVAILTCCLGCFCDFGRRIDDFSNPGPYQPRRGFLWVVACTCLPILIVADSFYVAITGNEDGFMHTTFDDYFFHLEKVADELPPMDVANKDDMLDDDEEEEEEENPTYIDVTSLPSISSSSLPPSETTSLSLESENFDFNKTSSVHNSVDDCDVVVVVSEEEEGCLRVDQIDNEIPQKDLRVNLVTEDYPPMEVAVKVEVELPPQQPRIDSSEDRRLVSQDLQNVKQSSSYGSIIEACSASVNQQATV